MSQLVIYLNIAKKCHGYYEAITTVTASFHSCTY